MYNVILEIRVIVVSIFGIYLYVYCMVYLLFFFILVKFNNIWFVDLF